MKKPKSEPDKMTTQKASRCDKTCTYVAGGSEGRRCKNRCDKEVGHFLNCKCKNHELQ